MIESVHGQAKKPPAPKEEAITRRTKDGVMVRCLYFAGTEGKNTAPVVLVHGWEGEGAEYRGLARELQATYGYAVVIPDLRGHGQSTRRDGAGRDASAEILRARFRLNDFRAMAEFDLEAVKSFLLEKHNAGELNIELLSIVGADMGAAVAAHWVARDWSWPDLPTYKQGQDVKVFVLISPPQAFQGLKLQPALVGSHPAVRSSLSAMIVCGRRNTKDARVATQIHRTLSRFHEPDQQDLRLLEVDSELAGVKLLSAPGSKVGTEIGVFIQRQLAKRKDRHPWAPRVNPLGS
jgi:pimeloyl-ACP methyl ester carboxylesterase